MMRTKIEKTLAWLTIVMMGLLILDVLWQIIARYLAPLELPPIASNFTTELAGYLLIWTGLLGAAYVEAKKEHIGITLLPDYLRKKGKERGIKLILESLILLFAVGVLLVGGIWLVYTRFLLDVKSATMQLPLGYVYLSIPLSGLFISYFSINNISLLLKKIKP